MELTSVKEFMNEHYRVDEAKDYYRLDTTAKDYLWRANKELNGIQSSIKNGNDFNVKIFNQVKQYFVLDTTL